MNTLQAISHDKGSNSLDDMINSACDDAFGFSKITLNYIILAMASRYYISHFLSQAVGDDGILQSMSMNQLPVIGGQLVKLLNFFLEQLVVVNRFNELSSWLSTNLNVP